MSDEREPIRFTRCIDSSRSLILRGQHWYVQDAGQPERLWALAAGYESDMGAEIERLTERLAAADAEVTRLTHDNAQNVTVQKERNEARADSVMWMQESLRVLKERDEALSKLAEAESRIKLFEAANEAARDPHYADKDSLSQRDVQKLLDKALLDLKIEKAFHTDTVEYYRLLRERDQLNPNESM